VETTSSHRRFHIEGIPFDNAEEALKLEKAVGGGWTTIDMDGVFLVVDPAEFGRVCDLGIKFSFLIVDPETGEIERIPMNEDSRLSARFVQVE